MFPLFFNLFNGLDVAMNKLIIWDFDGVISDTEHLSTDKYVEFAQKCGIILTRKDVIQYILGKGQKQQLDTLLSLGYNVDADMVRYINDEISKAVTQDISLTENVEDIFRLNGFSQCVATGNSLTGIKARFEPLHLDRYFNEKNTFSASFVAHGKPEPDLFLYASKKMNYAPKDCIVIEDSIYGIMAGLKANMSVIAYLEHILYDKQEYIKKINTLGKAHICNNMIEVKKLLLSI